MTCEDDDLRVADQEIERHIEQLLLTLTSPDRWEASCAASALSRLRDSRATPQLIAALSASERWVRSVAAGVLGELQDRRAVLPLIDALEHAEDELYFNVGVSAAHSLGKLGDPQAVDALARALERPYLQYAAVAALGRIGDRRAVDPLIASMRCTQNPSIPTVLGNFGDQRALEPLLTELAAIQRSPVVGSEPRSYDIY
jgi:HEAT repeat protein